MAKLATVQKPQGKTAAATKIEDILDRPSNAAERPKPMPAGTYLMVVQGLPRFDKSSKKQTPYVEFLLVPQSAMDDVDAAELEEMGGLADKTVKATFYLTDGSEYRLTEFLDACGVGEEDEDGEALSHRARIEETPNCQVYCTMVHEPSADGQRMFAKPGAFAIVE